jgi:hypothetical protein
MLAQSSIPRCWLTRCALLLILVVGIGAPAHSQSIDAVIRGRATDQRGHPLPGVTVTATPERTGVQRTDVTAVDGYFALPNLPAGTYTLRADLDGFSPRVRRAQTLYVGTTVTVDFTLAVAGPVEQVTVRGTLPLLETTKNTLSRIVQKEEIDALPVVDRNFNDLAAMAPGVSKTGVYGGVDINGSRDFQNAYQLDGVSAERQHLGDQRTAYAQDWVQEFQVLTSQYAAEFGQATGGVLNAVTRSGTNRLSGRAYGFFRNGAWDATPEFAGTKPPLGERRVGVTLGGPILKNRVFYFGGFERLHTAASNIVNSTFASANGVFPSRDERSLSLVKIDGFAGPNEVVRLRYNALRQQSSGSSIGGTSTEEHGRFSEVSGDDIVGGWTWVSPAALVNELRVARNTITPVGGCNFAARNPPGTWFERAYPGAQFGCPVNFGTIAENQWQFVENVMWVRGQHDVKIGIQAARTGSTGDFRNFRDGRYSFDRDLAFDLASPNSYPIAFVMIEGPTAWNVSSSSIGTFAQDNWRITDALALSVGVRYDVDSAVTALNSMIRTNGGLHSVDGDFDNIAPRAGVAWTPFHDRRTLLRAGAGLYYDQNHNNVGSTVLLNNILVDRIVTLNANSPLFNPYWPDIGRARALMAGALANNSVPDSSLLGEVAAATNDVVRHLQVPSTTQVGGGVVHEFSRWMNASADLVHARGEDLYVIRDTNVDPVTLQRLDSRYTAINAFANGGTSRYTALQLQASLISSAERFLKVAYTWATNRNNTNSTLSSGAATNPFDLSEDEGPADNDVRHNLVVNGSFQLPQDIQVSGILSVQSALPYSATTSAPRPDGKPFGFRPEPRNARRGDSALSLDLRIAKVVRLPGASAVTALVEMFNLTNATNYANYIGMITSSRFGEPTTSGPKRRVQLGLRFDF